MFMLWIHHMFWGAFVLLAKRVTLCQPFNYTYKLFCTLHKCAGVVAEPKRQFFVQYHTTQFFVHLNARATREKGEKAISVAFKNPIIINMYVFVV